MRQLAYEYYLNNGTLTDITISDIGVDNTCTSTNFYRYANVSTTSTSVDLAAYRCTSGGKPPDTTRQYVFYMTYYPGTGQSTWHCSYTDDNSSCFGLPP